MEHHREYELHGARKPSFTGPFIKLR